MAFLQPFLRCFLSRQVVTNFSFCKAQDLQWECVQLRLNLLRRKIMASWLGKLVSFSWGKKLTNLLLVAHRGQKDGVCFWFYCKFIFFPYGNCLGNTGVCFTCIPENMTAGTSNPKMEVENYFHLHFRVDLEVIVCLAVLFLWDQVSAHTWFFSRLRDATCWALSDNELIDIGFHFWGDPCKRWKTTTTIHRPRITKQAILYTQSCWLSTNHRSISLYIIV